MANRLPIDFGAHPSASRSRSRSAARSIRNALRPTLLRDDPDLAGRDGKASDSGTPKRSLQVLEEFLSPRSVKNPSQSASEALRKFGSLRSLVASARRNTGRSSDEGREPDLIAMVAASCALVEEALREELPARPFTTVDPAYQRYLRLHIGTQPDEMCLATFVGQQGRFLGNEVIGLGGRSSCSIPCGSIIRRAVELDAIGITIAHNHPSGSPHPSEDDKRIMELVDQKLADADIVLIDLLVVTHARVFSTRHQSDITE